MNDNHIEKIKGPVSNLPDSVPLVEGAMLLRSSNRTDTIRLADRINKMPAESLYALIGFIYGHGMMLASNWTLGGFIINRSIGVLVKRYNGDRYTAWITCLRSMVNTNFEDVKEATAGKPFLPKTAEAHENLKNKGMTLLQDMRKATVKHILDGKDREDSTSVGGFSQREMNAVNNAVTLLMSGEQMTIQELRDRALGVKVELAA